jgi:hypothetical protein
VYLLRVVLAAPAATVKPKANIPRVELPAAAPPQAATQEDVAIAFVSLA